LNVGEHLGRKPVGRSGSVEARHHIGRLEHRPGVGGDQEPGVVVDHVQDLDLGAVGTLRPWMSSARDLPDPKIVDFDEEAGDFLVDERYRHKRPDWTYADEAEGTG